jgi:hypothetical protein
MPDKTTLECPHCKNVSQTTHWIRPGAKVRCSRCDRGFRFSPSENDESNPEAELRSIGDVDLREFFTPESPPAPVSTKPLDRSNGNGKVRKRKRGVTNPALIRDPGSASSERSKDVLITGKPVRFEGSRKGTAVVLVFLLLALGYVGVLSVGWFMDYLDRVSHQKHRNEAKKFSNPKDPGAKPNPEVIIPAKIVIADKPKIVVDEEPPTVADKPRRIGDMEVCVIDARVGFVDQARTDRRMLITLQITNHSKRRIKYRCWSDPANKVELRDGTPNANRFSLIGPPAEAARDIEPGAKTEDILSFPPTPPLFGVDLVLPLEVGGGRFLFHLPREFIQQFD